MRKLKKSSILLGGKLHSQLLLINCTQIRKYITVPERGNCYKLPSNNNAAGYEK